MLRIYITLAIALALPCPAWADDAAATFKSRVAPVLAQRCGDCHSGKESEAGLDLTAERSVEQLRLEMPRWFRVLSRVDDHSMPPADADPLADAERETIAKWIRGDFTTDLKAVQQHEGRSRMRRLNRAEYASTVYDLFGVRPAVNRELPSDGRVDGYDKVSAALPLSSSSAAGYMKIADGLVARMFAYDATPRKYRLVPSPSEQSAGHILELDNGTKVSFNTDTTSGPLRIAGENGGYSSFSARVPGVHKLRMSVYGYQTDKPMAFGIYAGHIWAYPQLIDLIGIAEAPPGKAAVVETEVYLRTQFDSDIGVSDGFRLVPLGLGVQVPKNSIAANCKGPGLAIEWVEVEEPPLPLAGDKWLTADMSAEFQQKFLPSNATLASSQLPREEVAAVLTKSLRRIGERLYRRALADEEAKQIVDSCLASIDGGAQLRGAYLEAISAMLTSPDFLCVIEQPGPLDDFALASRLSLFLWNSTPDDELFELARQDKLRDAGVLRSQTERMLSDPRAKRFVDGFLDQWLGLWGIDNTTPDKDLYPEFDDELKISGLRETRDTFARLLAQNTSVREFVAPRQMLVNARLAKHYGLPELQGFALREIATPADSPFGGLWTQASVMKVTANGTLTSPVKRGVWVAERLLGTPIPPPPPNIEPVNPDTRGAKTLREQLARHSSEGSCKACHAKFDPYGFALESFDVMGGYRKNYRALDPDFAKLPPQEQQGRARWRDGLPVDCSGAMPEGTKFNDIRALRELLAQQPGRLARGLARHLTTYSTGTPVSPVDEDVIDEIVRGAAKEDYGVRSIVHGVVQSSLFRAK